MIDDDNHCSQWLRQSGLRRWSGKGESRVSLPMCLPVISPVIIIVVITIMIIAIMIIVIKSIIIITSLPMCLPVISRVNIMIINMKSIMIIIINILSSPHHGNQEHHHDDDPNQEWGLHFCSWAGTPSFQCYTITTLTTTAHGLQGLIDYHGDDHDDDDDHDDSVLRQGIWVYGRRDRALSLHHGLPVCPGCLLASHFDKHLIMYCWAI